MRNWVMLLFLVQLWAVSRSQRVGLVIGNVTFTGTNKTNISDSTTITVPHVYQASTALSLISLYRSNNTQPFTGFLASVTVAEGPSVDTLTISISANLLTSIAMSYEIGIQYIRVSNFSTFEVQSKSAAYNATTNSTNVTSLNKLMYTDGVQIDANLFIRGFTNIATLSTATIIKTNNAINYGVTIPTPVANASLTFDMLIANSTALFVDACITSTLFKNASITNTNWTIPKKTNAKYVFGVQPLNGTTSYRTDPITNTVSCNDSCSAFVLEIDSACLNTFVPVNDLQQLRGWQLPVIVVCGLLVMGVSTYLIYYLYVLNKREELAAGIFQEREHH